MAAVWRVARWTGLGALALLLIAAGLVFLLLRSQPGHDFFLRMALRQAPSYVNGEVEIGGIRSDGLLRGFSLQNLTIRDGEGRPFLAADSLEVRYSIRDLLAGNIVIVPVRLWSPKVTIETLPSDSLSNVVRIFTDPESQATEDEDGGSGISLALRNIEVHDGTFTLRLPLEEGEEGIPGGVVETTPEGAGRTQVIRLQDVQARISEADILNPDRAGERFLVERLSLVGHVLEEPFRLEEFRGEILREGARLSVEADRLWFPESELSGPFVLDWSDPEGAFALEADLDVDVLALSDFHWLEPRLPEGAGSLRLTHSGPIGGGDLRVNEADLRVADSRVRGDFGVDFGGTLRFADTDLEFLPFDLSLLDPWLPEPLPVEGLLRGRVTAEGGLSALALAGRLSLEEPNVDRPPWVADFDGTLHASGEIGVSNLELTVDPLPYEALATFLPEIEWIGEGRVHLLATGRLREGVEVEAEIEHGVMGASRSSILATGTVAREGESVRLALDLFLEPLSLDGVAAGLGQELPIEGELRGSVRATGLLEDLAISGRLTTPAGIVDASARLDILDPFLRYQAEGSIEDFHLDALLATVPERTDLTGDFTLQGSGGTLETLAGVFELNVQGSRIAGLDLERMGMQLRAEDGRLFVDSLALSSTLLTLSGTGDFPLREDQPDGEITVRWDASSLAALRPIVFGEEPIAADTLSALERQLLIAEGIDPDTLGIAEQIVLDGRVSGSARLQGRLTEVAGEAVLNVEEAVYGSSSLALAGATLTGNWAQDGPWRIEGFTSFAELQVDGFTFASGSAEGGYGEGGGDFELELESETADTYAAAGTVTTDSTATTVLLESLLLDLPDVQWGLESPARIRIAGSSYEIDGFRIVRAGVGASAGVTIAVDGLLDLSGDSDLVVRMSGVDLARVAGIAQTDRLPSGIFELDLDIQGPFDAPIISGGFRVHDLSFDGTVLTLVEGSADYAGQELTARLIGVLDGEERLTAEGRIPLDLSFAAVEERLLDEEMDATISVIDLPAATALGFLDVLEEVEGTLNGEIQLRGTPRDFSPGGEVRLRGGSVLLAELGTRLTGIDADFRLQEDGLVALEGTVRSQGTARLSGAISLTDLTNPGFEDIAVSLNGFQAVDRRDLAARIGGEVLLQGSLSAPRVGGRVTVEQGELFLDEIVRSADVVDLTDPSYFDIVDPLLDAEGGEAPTAQDAFLQNLRVDVDLALDRDFWLRSSEIDVEIAGDLIVTFDRREREILLIGTLEPVRGTYTRFSRQFQVQGGTVDFVGIPGINPNLNIDATTRLRTEGGEPLNITANVAGTLVNPRVTLSSDSQPPIAESDLISYLL
ncbi:MAG: translocation/assembly module TamB domain-containing protein, partial [Gemmatimonadota bacterium]